MGDIEKAGRRAHGPVLGDDTGKLHRQFPAAKFDHSAAMSQMPIEQ
jgi:hypothetical protein